MAKDYEAIREQVHNGSVRLSNGKTYEESTQDEKDAFDARIDELKQKQAEEEESNEKLEQFREECHKDIKYHGKNYDELTDDEKKDFDSKIDEVYQKRMSDTSESDDTGDETDPNQDMEPTRDHSEKKHKAEEDIER